MKANLLPMRRVNGENAIRSQANFHVQQMLFQRSFGSALADVIDKDQILLMPSKESDISSIQQSWKLMEMDEKIKQTVMTTATGTEAFMLNDAAAGYFGSSTGVFNPAVMPGIMEGNALKSLINKLWMMQPFPANDLSTKIIYFKKTDPFSSGAPTLARVAEGRAGSDIGFEVGSENVDAQRYIVHLPYTYELQKVLAGRLGLDAKVLQAFDEAAMYRDEYYSWLKWYVAMTAGTLEGVAFKLYRDGTIADVDGYPEQYWAWYNLTTGAIRAGDNTAYGSATVNTASGADISDLLSFCIETMAGSLPATGLTGRNYRYQWTPDYVAVPRTIANKMWQEFKDSNLQTVYISKNDIPELKAEETFFCRANVGNIPLDVWVIPDPILANLATANASTFVSTDSPTKTISPMFFGKYNGMAALAPASPNLYFTDEGFEVKSVGGVDQLRRNMTKVHTLFKLGSEMLLNASMSFLVKVIT